MRFEEGADVKIKVDKTYGDGTVISAGTTGVVTEVQIAAQGYLVNFSGDSIERFVLDVDLDPAG